MRLVLGVVVASILTAAAAAAPIAGGSRTIAAALVPGAEVQKPIGAVGASGRFVASGSFRCGQTEKNCDVKPGKLKWKLTFRHLTGEATAAHIHLGKPGKQGKVAIALCGPCKSGQTGTIMVSTAVFKAIQAGAAYVNVHTVENPAGEVRGKLIISAVL